MRVESVLLIIGTILIAIYLAVRVDSDVRSGIALIAFQAQSTTTARNGTVQPGSSLVDFSLWSQNRVAAYNKVIGVLFAAPVAVLSIPRLSLEVPVFDGVDEITLNRGAGRIPGTAKVGSTGNIGIAAHRDGFFRVLKDVRIGDKVELQVPQGKSTYTVTSTVIVSPEDVRVLAPMSHPAITLVTCYPFYFVGDAPQRFIVRAEESKTDFSTVRTRKVSSTPIEN